MTEGTSEHEVYLPTGALSPNRQTRDPLPDTLLKRVKQFSGRLSTEAVGSMQDRLPFFADLDAAQRAGVPVSYTH
ncbi:PucR family transcriptional regulator, partial [Nocardia salmonicida]